jgi:hypothetical protein
MRRHVSARQAYRVGHQEKQMNEEPRKPRVVRSVPGAPLAPEPHAATYYDEIPSEMHEFIAEQHPQEELARGRVIETITW